MGIKSLLCKFSGEHHFISVEYNQKGSYRVCERCKHQEYIYKFMDKDSMFHFEMQKIKQIEMILEDYYLQTNRTLALKIIQLFEGGRDA